MIKIFYITILLAHSMFLNTNEFFIKNANANNNRPEIRKIFTEKEDKKLVNLVKIYGENRWKLIADKMNLTIRKCKYRYLNYLSPNLKKTYWTKEEDEILKQKHEEYGSKWSTIADFLPGRTGVNLKNRWLYLNRLKKSHSKNDNLENEDEPEENKNSYSFKDSDDLFNSYNYHFNQ